jgi:hypothetical protein
MSAMQIQALNIKPERRGGWALWQLSFPWADISFTYIAARQGIDSHIGYLLGWSCYIIFYSPYIEAHKSIYAPLYRGNRISTSILGLDVKPGSRGGWVRCRYKHSMSSLRGGEDKRLANPDHDCQALAEMAMPGYQGWVKEGGWTPFRSRPWIYSLREGENERLPNTSTQHQAWEEGRMSAVTIKFSLGWY